jgi:hypothetical protein
VLSSRDKILEVEINRLQGVEQRQVRTPAIVEASHFLR